MSPNPPLDMGRQAWAHERGDRVVCRHFWRVEAKRLAHCDGKSLRRVVGRARRRWMILGVDRECLSKVRAAWGWLRRGRVSSSGESLEMVRLRKE
jgi:hypothetical protein